jgi:hypothetical protein
VAKLSPDGTALLFSSYLGGNDQDSIYGLDLRNGELYVAGRTASNDFPVTNGAPQTTYGGGIWDNFLTIVHLNPAQLVGVVSRKTHGSAGTFDVDLPPGRDPGIECRSGGANGEYTLVFTFANPLSSVGGANVASGTGSVASSGMDSNDANQYIVNLTGITNAQVVTVSLTNVSDVAGNGANAVSASLAVLIGDTTADRSVNSADIAQTKSQSGTAVTNANFREDTTADGSLNSADIALVKSKSGTALP